MPRFLIEVDATHAGIRTSARSRADSRRPFTAERDAPLPIQKQALPNAAASVAGLSPGELSAQNHSTSELLRTLSMVAASKPTSWLSGRFYILSHLACT